MAATPPLIAAATRDFLRRHPPFNRMSDEALDFVIPRLKLAYFAKNSMILRPQSGPVEFLHIVHRGLVGRRAADPQGEAAQTFGLGEMFPVGTLSAGGATSSFYVAVEDTFCYMLAREDWLELRQLSPEFERFCTEAITETLKQSRAELQAHYSQRAAEQQTMSRPVAELVRRRPITCPATAPLSDALAAMREGTVRTIVVVDDENRPLGIFTLIDLLERVVLAGKPLSTPIAEIMSSPAVTLPGTATAAEALQTLAERGIRQLLVVEGGGKLIGLISERDLFALQRVSIRQVGAELNAARDIEGLQRAADDIRRLTRNLLAQGVAAEPLTRTIASLNDALSRQVIELALARHDLAGIEWCWLALGSEGRSEQTFATDQDNALLFMAPPGEEERLRSKLLAFAREVNGLLDRIGFPLCPGNVMASNPDLCRSIEEWKAKFLEWLREPTPDSLLKANIVFDFRPLVGKLELAHDLRNWLFAYTQESRIFLRLMAQNALEAEAPLGLIRAFVTDDEPHKGTLDLKVRGTRLFVDAARVFALAQAIDETGTAARLRSAGSRLNVDERHVQATIEGFHFLQMLRLRQQDVASGQANANRLDPYALNDVDQRMLKEAFRQARKLQQRLKETYHL